MLFLLLTSKWTKYQLDLKIETEPENLNLATLNQKISFLLDCPEYQ